MIIDGKAIAADMEKNVQQALLGFTVMPTLAIIVVGNDPVVQSFVRIKKRMGERLNIVVVERYFPENISGEVLKKSIEDISRSSDVEGMVIQLPLPAHIDTQAMLDVIPVGKDVDMLSRASVASFACGDARILPPVAGAIQEILERAQVSVVGREVLVLGYGRLVGVPASILMRHNHAHVTVIDREISDLADHVRESSVIISGVGKQGLITPEMLSPSTVLIDAGASEAGGRIVGDADPQCAEIASVFTPVPGGVGPIAVAMIFKNLCLLARNKKDSSVS
jgi:methylenetetrahydrofolate dehydrogenase (NADP+)/methenyltetrahydrofolate cyclohydrolase